jgi:hypothetical protein
LAGEEFTAKEWRVTENDDLEADEHALAYRYEVDECCGGRDPLCIHYGDKGVQ